MTTVGQTYAPPEYLDSGGLENGKIRTGLALDNSNLYLNKVYTSHYVGNIPLNAKTVRREFMNYFANDGQVPWQNNFVHCHLYFIISLVFLILFKFL